MLNLFVLLRGQVHRLTPTFIIEPLFCLFAWDRHLCFLRGTPLLICGCVRIVRGRSHSVF